MLLVTIDIIICVIVTCLFDLGSGYTWNDIQDLIDAHELSFSSTMSKIISKYHGEQRKHSTRNELLRIDAKLIRINNYKSSHTLVNVLNNVTRNKSQLIMMKSPAKIRKNTNIFLQNFLTLFQTGFRHYNNKLNKTENVFCCIINPYDRLLLIYYNYYKLGVGYNYDDNYVMMMNVRLNIVLRKLLNIETIDDYDYGHIDWFIRKQLIFFKCHNDISIYFKFNTNSNINCKQFKFDKIFIIDDISFLIDSIVNQEFIFLNDTLNWKLNDDSSIIWLKSQLLQMHPRSNGKKYSNIDPNLSLLNVLNGETVLNINKYYQQEMEIYAFEPFQVKNGVYENEIIWIQNAGLRYRNVYYNNNGTHNSNNNNSNNIGNNNVNQCKILPIEHGNDKRYLKKRKQLQYLPNGKAYIYNNNSKSNNININLYKRNLANDMKNIDNMDQDYNFTIGLCTRFQNELEYIVEWIEYHHFLQKIDYIWLYDNLSKNQIIANISQLYNDHNWFEYIFWPKSEQQSYDDCYQRAKLQGITYLGLWDIDEFVYANDFDNLKQFVQYTQINFEKQGKQFSHFEITRLPFGTWITEDEKLNYSFVFNKKTKKFLLKNGNVDGIRTVIGSYLHRQPMNDYEEHMFRHEKNDCDKYPIRGMTKNRGHSVCNTGKGVKTMFNLNHCVKMNTHNCVKFNKNTTTQEMINNPIIDGIQMNHYYLRDWKKVFSPDNWKKYDKWIILLTNINKNWYNLYYDPMLANRYHHRISKRIFNLLACNNTN